MTSEPVKQATRGEWRELGFYYERDDSAKEWRISGSRDGLLHFARLIRTYALEPKNDVLAEHDHYGPYLYLEVGTWSEAQITDHWIAGPLKDLLRLSSVVEARVGNVQIGECIKLRDIYAPTAPYELVLEMRQEDFDPAHADPECW